MSQRSSTWASPTLDPTFNEQTAGSVYPTLGPSIAMSGTGAGRKLIDMWGGDSMLGGSGGDGDVDLGYGTDGEMGGSAPAGVGLPVGNLFVGGAVVGGLFWAMKLAAEGAGEGEEFHNPKISFFFWLAIILGAGAGLPLLKVATAALASRISFFEPVAVWTAAA